MSAHGPAIRPCPSCPYRRDAPSGLWSAEEYDRLPQYDLPGHLQPYAAFMCHQASGRLCAGWCAVHDMEDSIGLRLACSHDSITVEDVEAARAYVSPIPVFATGAEAAAHGKAQLETPGPRAKRMAQHIRHKHRKQGLRP